MLFVDMVLICFVVALPPSVLDLTRASRRDAVSWESISKRHISGGCRFISLSRLQTSVDATFGKMQEERWTVSPLCCAVSSSIPSQCNPTVLYGTRRERMHTHTSNLWILQGKQSLRACTHTANAKMTPSSADSTLHSRLVGAERRGKAELASVNKTPLSTELRHVAWMYSSAPSLPSLPPRTPYSVLGKASNHELVS